MTNTALTQGNLSLTKRLRHGDIDSNQVLSFAKSRSLQAELQTRPYQSDSSISASEINQHRMVLVVEPAAEDIETAGRLPGPFIGERTPPVAR